MSGAPTTAVFPQRDEDGNLLETQFGRSVFRDQQVRRLGYQQSQQRRSLWLTVFQRHSSCIARHGVCASSSLEVMASRHCSVVAVPAAVS